MILFHDIDGCLNHPDGTPLGFSRDALSARDAQELAHLGELLDQSDFEHIILNTGRVYEDCTYLCDYIGSTKARYLLVEHGSGFWDRETGSSIDLHSIADQHNLTDAKPAIDSISRVQELISWFIEHGQDIFAHRLGLDSPLEIHGNQRGNLTFKVPDNQDGEALMASLHNWLTSDSPFTDTSFNYHHSRSDGFIDVMGAMDKGKGIDLAVAYLEANLDQTVAVGNGLNDLEMLQTAGLAICPANAEPEVKAICREIGMVSEHSFINATKDWLRTDT